MSMINVTNLTFAYEGSYDTIFENVSFQFDTDWKLGFTGRNGRGKTTFLNLLQGKYEYSGNISASVEFEYFPYEVADKSVLTIDVAENINPDFLQWKLKRELNQLELDDEVLYRPFETLSNGEQTKVLLAILFLKENSFLLIDEPTNHLDQHGRQIVGNYLRSKKGFVLVSHDRAFLDHCIDHILSINKTNIEIQQGTFSSWFMNKTRQDTFERTQNEKLKKDIKRLSTAAKRTADWSDKVEQTKHGSKNSGLRPDRGYIGARAASMMQRSKSLEERQLSAIEEKSGLLKNIESARPLKLSQSTYHANQLVTLQDVSIYYGDITACSNIRFEVERGDRVALCGANGSGKSSILKLICGEEIAYTGALEIGSGLTISYVSQDTCHLCGNLADYAAACGVDESVFKGILRKLDFSRTQFEKDIADFSGGQKKKVLIARSLCEGANLLLWDEPLNYIDILSRMQIEDLLIEHKPTIVFVEHDKAFCQRIATKTILL